MKKRYSLITVLCSVTLIASAQYIGTAFGKVFDTDQESTAFANILFLSPIDSSMVKAEVSSDDYSFRNRR